MGVTPRRRRWVLAALGAGALLVPAYFFLQDQVVDGRLQPILQKELGSLMGSPVTLGGVHADLRGGVQLRDLSFQLRAGGMEVRAVIPRALIRLSLGDLLFRHHPLADCLESLSVRHPQVFLRRLAPSAVPGLSGPSSAPVSAALPLLPFKKVLVRDGELFFQASAENEPKEVVGGIRLQAQSDDDRRWGVWVEAQPPDPKSSGSLALTGSVNLTDARVVGQAKFKDWELDGLGSVLKSYTGWSLLGGRANLEVPFAYRPGSSPWFDIRGHVEDASVRAPGEDGVLFTGIEGRTSIRPSGLALNQPLHFQIGQTPFAASGFVPFTGGPVSLAVSSQSLYLPTLVDDVLRLKDLKSDGVGRADLTVRGPLSDPVLQGSAELGTSHLGDWQLDSLALSAQYSQGVFQLTQVTGRLYDGLLTANGQVLIGPGQEPVSMTATLEKVQAKPVAALLGLKGMEGTTDAHMELGGTLQEPRFSSSVSMNLVRTLRNTLYHYSIQNDIQLQDRKLLVSVVLNGEGRLWGEFNEGPDGWEFGKLSLVNGKKTVHFQGNGYFPKDVNAPMRLEIRGQDIVLQDLAFFKDQFPEVQGKVGMDLVISGTRAAPQGTLQFQSQDTDLGKGLTAGSLEAALDLTGDQLTIRKLDYQNPSGRQFSIRGTLGLQSNSPLDLQVHADRMPLALLTEITNLNNLPQPFRGTVTGKIHFAGVRKNPIVEGEGRVSDLQVGDWSADQVDALITLDQGKVHIEKVDVAQAGGSLKVTGTWDTAASPARMTLAFSARHFQMAKGPFLTGDFSWNAQTGAPWWGDWRGLFSSPAFSLGDAGGRSWSFTDFSTNAVFKNGLLKGEVALGPDISGSAQVDLTGENPQLEADLKIAPATIDKDPNLGQFLPAGLRAAGQVSGEVKMAPGTVQELPLEGHFVVADGQLGNYRFDKLKLDFSGDRAKISPSLDLEREEASYRLSGTVAAAPATDGSTPSFWGPDAQVDVNGPFTKEKLANLLALTGLDTTGHQVEGTVDGNLAMTGTFGRPELKFELQGTDLRFDDIDAPSADLHFSAALADKRLTVGASHIQLSRGRFDVDQGTLSLAPGLLNLDLEGTADKIPIALFQLSSHVRLAGQVSLAPQAGRPTFAGTLALSDQDNPAPPFTLSLRVDQGHVVFQPLDNSDPQLVGEVDYSQPPKILFDHLRLVNSPGSFQVDGVLDPQGDCRLTSDAQNVPIGKVGKWLLPGFPVSGKGTYHLMLQGTLAQPIFNASFSVMGGKYKDLSFDLLSGDLKSKENTLMLGSAEVPLVISKKGLYSFTLHGTMPFTFSPAAWSKIKNQEMDLDAEMDQGDFSLILLTGLVKSASGNMDFSAHVGGTLDDPVLNMDLDLSKASLVPFEFAHSVDDISGRIKVRDNHVAIDDLNGLVGRDRLFVWTPPLSDSKMVLQDFIPQALDLRVRTVGNHGLYLNIPGIMDESQWGEIEFYGATPGDPMLIVGPITQPEIHGTALLQSGHYTFPPKPKGGKVVTYNALGNVLFDLTLVSGSNAWYANDFAGQYLELKIDPGDQMKITGKDSDKTPDTPGIKCTGKAGSQQGFLRYLGQQFQLEQASLYIPKGKLPTMQGRATETLKNVQIVTAGGVRQSDVQVYITFSGTFGNVDFKLDSSPHLATTNDAEAQQQLLLSYIMFGRDMTGYTREDLQKAYQQNVGGVISDAALQAIDRIASANLTNILRPIAQGLGGVDVNVVSNAAANLGGTSNTGTNAGTGPDAGGDTLPAGISPVFKVQLQKYLDPRLSVQTNLGLLRDEGTGASDFQGQVGLGYDVSKNLQLNAITGNNDSGQPETKFTVGFHADLPNMMSANKNDKVPPQFVNFDVLILGPDKVQVSWGTDKVTHGEVQILDAAGNLVRSQAEPNKFDYDHTLVVDGLKPDSHYQVQVMVRDLNQNQNITQPKAFVTPPG